MGDECFTTCTEWHVSHPASKCKYIVMETLDILSRVRQGWERDTCWVSGCRYFHINSKKIKNLSLDLRWIRWVKELLLVHFSFSMALHQLLWSPSMIQQWSIILLEDKVAINGRMTSSSKTRATYGLPELPQVYKALNTLEASPFFIFIKASDFHGYEPDNEYTPLTDTKWSYS